MKKQKIRMILSKRGYKIFMKALDHYQDERLKRNVVNSDTCSFFGNLSFFKWDNPREYKLIQSLITVVMAHRVTYRICIVEQDYIQLSQNTEPKDRSKNIPMPSISCRVQDAETIKKLSKFQKNKEVGGNINGI